MSNSASSGPSPPVYLGSQSTPAYSKNAGYDRLADGTRLSPIIDRHSHTGEEGPVGPVGGEEGGRAPGGNIVGRTDSSAPSLYAGVGVGGGAGAGAGGGEPLPPGEEPAPGPSFRGKSSIFQSFVALKNLAMPADPYRELVKDLPRWGFLNMTLDHPIRKGAVLIIKSRGFETFILLVILINCIFMAMQSNRPGFAESAHGIFLARADYFFTAVFSLEMVLKIISLGIVYRRGSYLRDGFNVLDFVVVTLAYINFVPGVGNYTAVRAIRVLRPLRTITRVKGMRRLVVTLLNSIPLLLDVVVLCAFFFFVYGIVAVTIFGGNLRDHCGMPIFNETVVRNVSIGAIIPKEAVTFFIDSDELDRFCSGPYQRAVQWHRGNDTEMGAVTGNFTGGSGGMARSCPHPLVCARGPNPNYGFTNFDNILWAWLSIFITVTLDGWSDFMYMLQESINPFIWPFFISLIFVTTYFMVNLTLAVLYTYFKQENEGERERKLAREQAKEESRRAQEAVFEAKLKEAKSSTALNLLEASQSQANLAPPRLHSSAQSGFFSQAAAALGFGPGPQEGAGGNGTGNGNGTATPAPPSRSSVNGAAANGSVRAGVEGRNGNGNGDGGNGGDGRPSAYPSPPPPPPGSPPAPKERPLVDGPQSDSMIPLARGRVHDRFADDPTGPLVEEDSRREASARPASRSRSRALMGFVGRLVSKSVAKSGPSATQVASLLPLKRISGIEDAKTVYKLLSEIFENWAARGIEIPRQQKIRLHATNLLSKWWFESTMSFLILLNTAMMAAEHYQQPKFQTDMSSIINYIVTGVFVLEMLVKHCAYGPKYYWTDGTDFFDGMIIFASIVDIVVSNVQENKGASAISALRSLRLLRIMKLARSWKELQKIINAIFRAVGSIGYLSLLILLFTIIFALLGMQLFGYRLQFCDAVDGSFQTCPPGEPCPDHHGCYLTCDPSQLDTWIDAPGSAFYGSDQAYCESFPRPGSTYVFPPGQDNSTQYLAYVGRPYVPRFNFDDFYFSVVTVFQCLSQDGWSGIMFDCMRSVNGPGRYVYIVYFLLLMVVGLYIMLNLFLAILLDGFSLSEGDDETKSSSLVSLGKMILNISFTIGAHSRQLVRKGSNMIRSRSQKVFRPKNGDASVAAAGAAPRIHSEAPSAGAGGAMSDQSSPERAAGGLVGRPSANGAAGGGTQRASVLKSDRAQSSATQSKTAPSPPGRRSEGGQAVAFKLPHKQARNGGDGGEKNGGGGGRALESTQEGSIDDPDMLNEDDSSGPRRMDSRASASGPPTLEAQLAALNGRSLFLFQPTSKIRLFFAHVVFHRLFDVIIMMVIVASSLALALDSPLLHPKSKMKANLKILDTIFVVLFAVEAGLKILVLGFALHKGAYIRSAWNILDLSIVVLGIVLESLPGSGNNKNIRSLRVLRTLRALRPLRLISWNAGMRIVVNALFQSIPPLGDVLIVCILVYFIFGIVGINLMAGKFYACVDSDTGDILDPRDLFPPGATMTREWCEQNGGWHAFQTYPYHFLNNLTTLLPNATVIKTEWRNPPVNFDNIGNALLTLYEVASLELWENVMLNGADTTLVGEQPRENANRYFCIYFILFVMFGAFFILNLFVGVVIDKFNDLKQKAEGQSMFLTEEQQSWVEIQKLMALVGPRKTYTRPTHWFRARVFDFILSKRTEMVIMGAIVANILQMAVEHYGSSFYWTVALSTLNIFFTAVFIMEAVLKLIAIGPVWYFRDRLNQFDFLIIVVSTVVILIDYGPDGRPSQGGAGVNLLRIFRVTRIMRLIPRAKGLRTLVQTLLFSLPALWNVGSVLFMFFFIFAVMGMQLFGRTVYGDYLDPKVNFNSFPTALLTLFRTLTGENWPGLMHDTAGDTITKNCIQMVADYCADPPGEKNISACNVPFSNNLLYNESVIGTYNVPTDYIMDRCPTHRSIAIFYFCAFTVFCAYILLNLVIAIILDNFQSSSTEESLPISKQHMTEYVETWAKFDPAGSGYIPARKLPALIAELPFPMGAAGSDATLADIQMIIMTSDIPNREGRVHFFETLHSLSARIAGTDLPFAAQVKVHNKLSAKLPRTAEEIKHTVAHYHAALYVQAAVRGMLARQAVKEHLDALFTAKENAPDPMLQGMGQGSQGGRVSQEPGRGGWGAAGGAASRASRTGAALTVGIQAASAAIDVFKNFSRKSITGAASMLLGNSRKKLDLGAGGEGGGGGAGGMHPLPPNTPEFTSQAPSTVLAGSTRAAARPVAVPISPMAPAATPGSASAPTPRSPSTIRPTSLSTKLARMFSIAQGGAQPPSPNKGPKTSQRDIPGPSSPPAPSAYPSSHGGARASGGGRASDRTSQGSLIGGPEGVPMPPEGYSAPLASSAVPQTRPGRVPSPPPPPGPPPPLAGAPKPVLPPIAGKREPPPLPSGAPPPPGSGRKEPLPDIQRQADA